MEELTLPQQKALETGEPLRLIDPRTERIYVLVRAEVYEKLAQDESISPGVLRSKKTFLRDLPALLQKYDRWTVAYCGDEQVALVRSALEVLRECQKRGLQDDQFFLGIVAPYDDDDEIEPSLHEFDSIDE